MFDLILNTPLFTDVFQMWENTNPKNSEHVHSLYSGWSIDNRRHLIIEKDFKLISGQV